jgi:hypothetical protein
MDTLEDNNESYGIYLDKHRKVLPTRVLQVNTCPVCNALMTSENELQSHIFQFHRHFQAYVKVNDLVITRESFVHEPIREINIFYAGTEFIEGRWKTEFENGTFIVKSGLPFQLFPSNRIPVLDGKIEIQLGHKKQEYVFTIVQTHNPGLKYDDMEGLFYNYQSKYLKDRIGFEWSSFRNSFGCVKNFV